MHSTSTSQSLRAQAPSLFRSRKWASAVDTRMVPFECAIAVRLLAIASVGMYGGDTIIAAPASFQHWWKRAIAELGMDPEVFRPYGLRRGGATSFFSRSGSLETTLFRGRWSSIRTARAYIVEGMSLLAQLSLELPEAEARLYLRTLQAYLDM